MEESFEIEGLAGKKTLEGTISVRGAKNAALKVMAASLIFGDSITVENVPDIEDISRMRELLSNLGAGIANSGDSYTISGEKVDKTTVDPGIAKRLRASVSLTGPLLARFGEVRFPHPGGCAWGSRPIDFFIDGFKKMGATVREEDDFYIIKSRKKNLQGADIFLPFVSVSATEVFMMAGVLAEGTTRISNAAMEPEVVSLAKFLKECGADIRGIGTPFIEVVGRGRDGLLLAEGKAYRTIPDRLETGSFLILGALAAKELEITDCNPEDIGIVTTLMRDAGVDIEVENKSEEEGGGRIIVKNKARQKPFSSFSVKTHEYPGFPTDIQAPMTVFLTQSEGEALVFETIYEGRLNYTQDLLHMGADITMFDPHRVLVKGPTPLKGKELWGPDIRAGLAFLIAAVIAEGNSTIHNAYYIDRGYEAIETRLASIGAEIRRIKS